MFSNYNNRSSELVIALDIGTTKVCAVAGRLNELGKIEILGVGKVASEGVLRGVVANIDKTVKAISDAIDIAEREAKHEFRMVHVGIAGQHIKSLHHRGILTREDAQSEITKEDVTRIINDMYKLALPPGDKILHVIPQEFNVDDEEGIIEPVGMSGARLEGNFHVITGKLSSANNILRSVNKAGLEVQDMTLEPIASATSVLSEREKVAGVALVDIGGGTTDISIFHEGILRHTAVIPFGGNVITKDIKDGCSVITEQAEKLKVKFGSALADEIIDNRIITIPGFNGRDAKEISERNLARIIQARVEEILDYVVWEIQRTGYERKLIAGIVLTGGGSLLRHIDLLCEFHTGFSTRIGEPTEHLSSGYDKEMASPIYATAIGLLMHGIANETHAVRHEDDEEGEEEDEESSTGKWFGMIINKGFGKVKEFFEATPDTEF